MMLLSRFAVRSMLRFKNTTSVVTTARRFCTNSETGFPKRESTESVFVMEETAKAGIIPYLINKNGVMSSSPISAPWRDILEYDLSCDISNSCNGMVLVNIDTVIYLYNPFTRCFAKVLTLDCLDYDDSEFSLHNMSLCYDKFVDDYKAVLQLMDSNGTDYLIQASLKEKRWNKITVDGNFLGDCGGTTTVGVEVEGKLHWLVYDISVPDTKIMCFNHVLNVFEEFPSLPSKRGDDDRIVGLGVLDGYLWMARRVDGDLHNPKGDVEVLKMAKYGLRESWTSMLVLSNIDADYEWGFRPLLMTKQGKFLFSLTENPNIIWAYDLKTKSCKKFFKQRKSKDRMVHAVSFVSNSTSPARFNWDPIEHKDFGKIDLK